MTWNCAGGPFSQKYDQVTRLDPEPDVAILQEIARPDIPLQHCVWNPSGSQRRGVAVIARNGFSALPYPVHPDVPPVFVPVTIRGAVEFHLLAVWTKKKGKYVESFRMAFDRYRDFLSAKPAVIAGDFNSNTIWDRQHPKMNHSMVVDYCARELGLFSSYHKKMGVPHGQEPDPTFFQSRDEKKPYHIDYCFVPDSWHIEKVEIGKYDTWTEKSDHCPLITDISIDSTNRME